MNSKVTKLIMTAEEIKDREKWLDARKLGIGGSDAAAIVNMSPWSNPYKLWGEKIGAIQPEDISNQTRVYLGTLKEDSVATAFEHYSGKKVQRCGMFQSVECPFMLATPDRLVVGENAGLECKTTEVWNREYWEDEKIPDSYYVQVLHYMAVCGFDTMYIACMIGNSDFIWKTIKREDVIEDITSLVEAEKKFWNEYVVPQVAPPVDCSDACKNILNSKYPKDALSDNLMQMDVQTDNLCGEITTMKEEFKALKKDIALKENQLRDLMKDCTKAEGPVYKASYAYQNGNRSFDEAGFREAHPEVTDLDKYFKQSVNRVLRITKQKVKKI